MVRACLASLLLRSFYRRHIYNLLVENTRLPARFITHVGLVGYLQDQEHTSLCKFGTIHSLCTVFEVGISRIKYNVLIIDIKKQMRISIALQAICVARIAQKEKMVSSTILFAVYEVPHRTYKARTTSMRASPLHGPLCEAEFAIALVLLRHPRLNKTQRSSMLKEVISQSLKDT
jgi:hypothetical protein